jgi:thiamine biosynthesis lipoprotein
VRAPEPPTLADPDGAPLRSHVEHVMGTAMSISTPPEAPDGAIAAAFALLHRADEVFSTYRKDSSISRLRAGGIAIADCPPEVPSVLRRCAQLKRLTGGFFDAWPDGPTSLDPSGLVKGWAAERASAMLAACGAPRHCVVAAGDVRVRGVRDFDRCWRVGIADPHRPGRLLGVVEAPADLAVATSGTAERGAHIWDPVRRRPADALASVTIVGPDLGDADAFASAAFAMGEDAPDWLATLPTYQALLVRADGARWASPGMRAYLPDATIGPGWTLPDRVGRAGTDR